VLKFVTHWKLSVLQEQPGHEKVKESLKLLLREELCLLWSSSLNSSFISDMSRLLLAATVDSILVEWVRNIYHNQFVTYIIILIMVS
jgi:hypothetical protein